MQYPFRKADVTAMPEKPSGKFGPEDVCTRAQVVTFLYRLLRYAWDYDTSSVPDFSDVKKDTY